MVFYVLDPSNEKKRLTLKMSWQDMECIADQAAVMKRLKDNPHANVVVPLEYVFLSYVGGYGVLTHTEHSTLSGNDRYAPLSARSEVFSTTRSAL